MKTEHIFLMSLVLFHAPCWAAELQDSISKASDQSATIADDGVVRITWARDDVKVQVDGIDFPPAAGLGSWAAFKDMGGHAMLMGDTVVFEDEMTPAMDAAFANGLEITGIHNHFIYDDPPVYFMHVGGMGEPAELAAGVKAVWDTIKALRNEQPVPQRLTEGALPVTDGEIDPDVIQEVLGIEPEVTERVVKFTFPKEGNMHGVQVGGSMGLTTWAAFIGADDNAAVDGDFMMAADEVQAVMHALRENEIQIVALHNHMIGEEPTSYFLHYWGRGTAADLAKGIKAALDVQAEIAR
jgi:hypothetical protein